MKPFHFQQFQVLQSKDVFRVGTDAVLLGALASVVSAKKILEIGTGTGLISLMLAQRNPKTDIVAIDILETARVLSSANFENSIFRNRISSFHQDFKSFETNERFDLIISNPPYFEENESVKDIVARQKTELDFFELIQKSSELVSENGIFSVIIPSSSAEYFIAEAESFNMKIFRKINIFGIKNGSLKRNILEFSKSDLPLETTDFVIEKSPRQYSDQYLELTKEFHVFNQ